MRECEVVDVAAFVSGVHAPLVRRLAHQMIARLLANVELDDMIQAGMMGLMDAVGALRGIRRGRSSRRYAAQPHPRRDARRAARQRLAAALGAQEPARHRERDSPARRAG
ncbi:MAG: hypothetical protein MZV64_48575 [Ignavibacteriales bacterium]|nr:hypothetical protein [Ignavibacteriales bacterium]